MVLHSSMDGKDKTRICEKSTGVRARGKFSAAS